MRDSTPKIEFLHGVRAELPILLGVIPFGLIFGALAIRSGLTTVAAQAMSVVMLAGSAQFIAVQMIGAGASAVVILAVIFVVNLRHALYSASLALHIRHLSDPWKLLLAYLLTDEAYAVAITHYNRSEVCAHCHWYHLGAGLTLWVTWQASTALGILAGSYLPPDWPLSFALPLTFIALVVPALKDRATVAAAVAAGLVGLLTIHFPYKIGLLLAALCGIVVGVLVEGRRK
jgi:4-azaleucine resistance transporter AzlC